MTSFLKGAMRFNWYLGNILRKKSSHVIFLEMCYTGKSYSPNIVFNTHWKNGTDFIFFLPHISSDFIFDIIQLYHHIYMIPNRKDTLAVLPVVDVMLGVVEAVLVEAVVDTIAEVVEAVVVAHQFSMDMVPLLVDFSLEQLQLVQQ